MSSFRTGGFSDWVTKILQGLVSQELRAYISVFSLFLTQVNYGHIIERM